MSSDSPHHSPHPDYTLRLWEKGRDEGILTDTPSQRALTPTPAGGRGDKNRSLRPVGLHPSPFALWEKGRDEGILTGCPNSCLNFSSIWLDKSSFFVRIQIENFLLRYHQGDAEDRVNPCFQDAGGRTRDDHMGAMEMWFVSGGRTMCKSLLPVMSIYLPRNSTVWWGKDGCPKGVSPHRLQIEA